MYGGCRFESFPFEATSVQQNMKLGETIIIKAFTFFANVN